MLNKVMIIGRLGAEPKLAYTSGGIPVCRFNLATDESYTDQSGQRQERTEWHRVVVFSKQAEACANYLHKGSLAFVEGILTTNKWTDQEGQTRYTTEIKAYNVRFLTPKAAAGQSQQAEQSASPEPIDTDYGGDEDIPF